MGTGSQVREWTGPSRRRVPRFRLQEPMDVTVVRGGLPDTLPGRTMNVGERGIAAMLAGELQPGETVNVEVRLSPLAAPLRTSAQVKYYDRLRCGFEFVSITPEQRSAIRDWAKEVRAEAESSVAPPPKVSHISVKQIPPPRGSSGGGGGGFRGKPKTKRSLTAWMVATVIVAFIAGVFLWRWNRAWGELESGLKQPSDAPAEKTNVRVPTEVMQKLLVHRVDPVYPAEARKEKLEGIIALDIVVGQDGSVVSTKALNGPDILATAATDALRWWKFEPYRVNGEPVTVETTVAVEFKR
jgi:TonB family protein